MKETTIAHFGNTEVKYSVYWKAVSRGSKRGKGRRYYLRQTLANAAQSTEVRITINQVEELKDLLPESGGMELVEARCKRAAEMLAEGKRPQRISLVPRLAEAHAETQVASA